MIMLKKMNLKGAKVLSKKEQKHISGGFFGCQPQFIECSSDRDCPILCGSTCGITITAGGQTFEVNICSY